MKVFQKILVIILQVVSVLLLLLAIGSSYLYFQVSSSDNGGSADTLPSLFGYSYLPISQDKFESTLGIEKGSLVLAQETSDYEQNMVVVFRTTEDLSDNAAYSVFGMGCITGIVTAEDGSTHYLVQNVSTFENAELAQDDLLYTAQYQIPNGGDLLILAQSSNGIVFFVILPFFCFVAIQLLVLILAIAFHHSSNEEDDDEVAEEKPAKKEKKKKHKNEEEENTDQDYEALKEETSRPHEHVVFTEEEANAPMNLTFKKKFDPKAESAEPVSGSENTDVSSLKQADGLENAMADSLNLKFTKKSRVKFSEDLKDETLKETVPPAAENASAAVEVNASQDSYSSHLLELLNQAKNDVQHTSDSIAAESFMQKPEKPQSTTDFMDLMSRVDSLLGDIQGQSGHEEEQAFLREAIDRDIMRGSTMEYNLTTAQKAEQESQQDEAAIRSQQILDNILIQLRDEELNVSFDDISEGINISQQPDGDGFTIDTPHYKAKIHVEMDRK